MSCRGARLVVQPGPAVEEKPGKVSKSQNRNRKTDRVQTLSWHCETGGRKSGKFVPNEIRN